MKGQPRASQFASQLVPARQTRPASHDRDVLQARPHPYADRTGVDYRKHVGVVLRHRRLIAGVAAVSLALGLIYTLLQTPTYRASATIQIKRAAANVSGIAGLEPVSRPAQARNSTRPNTSC